jgi:hypothetical protein
MAIWQGPCLWIMPIIRSNGGVVGGAEQHFQALQQKAGAGVAQDNEQALHRGGAALASSSS